MAAKARILAIDDQLYFRSFLEGLLSEEGYEVVSAGSEASALDCLRHRGPFDLVIMDLVMPDTDGIALLSRIHGLRAEQDVIVVSGVGDPRSVVEAMKSGASDYLLKPIERENLVRTIRSLLDRRRVRAEQVRLVSENLEFMGRIALYERGFGLLGLPDASSVASALLEMLCSESGARAGVIWGARTPGEDPSGLVAIAQSGILDSEEPCQSWVPPSVEIDAALRSGSAIVHAPEKGDPVLFVPLSREGRLEGVAGLSSPGEGGFTEPCAEGCTKLAAMGALALSVARERERLLASSFLDHRTGRPSRAFLEEVTRTEIQKAQRYGRRLALLCIDLEDLDSATERPGEVLAHLTDCVRRALRTTDVLASENGQWLWILVTDADPVGGVVLKRRIGQRVRATLRERGIGLEPALGVACFPLDGESFESLVAKAVSRARHDQRSVVRQIGIDAGTPLAEIGARLLAHGVDAPADLVSEAAELLIGELSTRPRDRGLLFVAPGPDRAAFLGPLVALGDMETATDVFLANDGDTIPSGPNLTALPLPADVPLDTTWIVRFGEAPPYVLVAGPSEESGRRRIYHSSDPVLVEHMTFRLRSEIGFGVRG